ncbi:Alpha/Beta hydrolase protein [Xylariomycetidae sp. FL2044]|nr:Alpha/Beta hydrolase protein [Xylariomycetidae sp. FL2044]
MATSTWSTQALRIFYTIKFWVISAPHVLFLSAIYAIPQLRPVPQWNYKVSIGAAIMRAVFRHQAEIRYQKPLQMIPGKSKDRFVLIPPPDTSLFRGIFGAPLATTQPSPVGAVWHPEPVTPSSATTDLTGKVVVYAAGGAFVLGWDPDDNAANVSALATKHFGATHVLYMQYRLASRESPFPAAAQDFFTTYQYVLGLGVPLENIVLMGDSAGGNIVLAVLRYLAEHDLPQPGGAAVFSPWVEVTSEAVQRYDKSKASQYDILDVPLLTWGVDAYWPRSKTLHQDEESYISPLHHPFRLDTPLFINSGGLEGFYESIQAFAKQMMAMEGNKVHFHTSVDLPHDFFLTYPVLGTKAEAGMVLEEARDFLIH